MAKQDWHIVTFSRDEPRWNRFDGNRLIPEEPSSAKKDGPVIVLLPDDFFFFILVSTPRTLREHKVHAGLRLRMQHSFPAPVHGQEQGSFRLTSKDILGYNAHPALKDFTQKNQSLIDSADVITTSFIISMLAARQRDLGPWVWENGDGPGALISEGDLHFFRSGQEEFEKRKTLLNGEQPPSAMSLHHALEILFEQGIRPSRMRLPLRGLQSSREFEPKFWSRAIAAIAIAGTLFCLGEYLRMHSVRQSLQVFESSINSLYVDVLGEDPGPDPFGTLLFRIEQRRGGGQGGIDVLGLLATLSDNAPGGFTLEGINFNGESGSIRGLIDSYDQLDAMLERVGTNQTYAFSLEQASNTQQGILLNLNFVKQ